MLESLFVIVYEGFYKVIERSCIFQRCIDVHVRRFRMQIQLIN